MMFLEKANGEDTSLAAAKQGELPINFRRTIDIESVAERK